MAYCGPETGCRDNVSYVLPLDKITLVLTAALSPGHEIAKHIALHHDSVKVLAFWVNDTETTFNGDMELILH